MAIGKPKLSPESICTLLKIGSKRAEEYRKYNVDQKSSMFDFFKLLSVSKSFLNTSRKASYNIYCLSLDCYGDLIYLSVTSRRTVVFSPAKLSIEHAHNLIKFLHPLYFNVNFQFDASSAMIEKVTKILQDTYGKIALTIGEQWDDENIYKFINQFMVRIYDFTCDAEFLNIEEPYSFPLLDRFEVSSVENPGQLARILHYKTKELKLAFYENHFEIPENSIKNLSVKKLELKFSRGNHDDAKQMSTDLLKICPNAKQFDVNVRFAHQTNSANEISDIVVACGQCAGELKARFANDLSQMAIKFDLPVRVSGKKDISWVQKVRGKAVFSGWDIAVDLNDDDELTLKFSDDKCNLTIVVDMYFRGN